MDPRRDVPRGSVLAMHTLLIAAVLTLVFNTGAPGRGVPVRHVGVPAPGRPLGDLRARGSSRTLLGLLFMIGLIASFFTIIFAYGRNTYSLSRAGYFPKFLSKTHGERKTPHVALIAGAVVGYAVAVLVYILQQKTLGAADRGGAAEHGGVRGGDLVHPADDVVRHAPTEPAEHRATVPEQVGGPGRGDRRRPRRDLARRDLPELGLSPGRVRRRHLLRPRRPVLRDRRAAPAGALAGGGVRAHAGRERRARTGGIRDLEGGAGVDPGGWDRSDARSRRRPSGSASRRARDAVDSAWNAEGGGRTPTALRRLPEGETR